MSIVSIRRIMVPAVAAGLLGLSGCDRADDVALIPSVALDAEPAVQPSATGKAGKAGKAGSGSSSAERINVSASGEITTMDSSACDPVEADNRVIAALSEGDADGLSAKSVIDYTARLSDCRWERARAVQSAITEGLPPITWNATHDQPRLGLVAGDAVPLLRGNASGKGSTRRGDPMAVASLLRPRAVALSANPMRTGRGPGMDEFLTRTLTHLSGGNADPAGTDRFTVAIAQMSDSYYFRDRTRTRQWLDETYGERVSYNDHQACDGAALAACAETADLLLLGSAGEPDVNALTAAMEGGLGTLYMHIDGGRASTDLLPLFGVSYMGDNYWGHPTLEAAPALTGRDAAMGETDALFAVMETLERDTLPVDFMGCENHSCPDDSAFTTRFRAPVDALHTRLRALDGAGTPLFDQPGMAFDKAAVLMGDLQRTDARFPLDVSDGRSVNLRMHFADKSVAHLRRAAPRWSDLGNHGASDARVIPTSTREVALQSRKYYRSAGVYALPGQTIRVTRTDDVEATTTKLRVNLVRWGATHPFDRDGYKRPAQVSSPDMPIAPGETVTLTSPAGGPVFIRFDGETQTDVSFTFENVGSHPVWRSPADDAAFIAAVDSGLYDWAEIITPGFEVHSTTEKMQATLDGDLSPADIAALTSRNFTDYSHALAGLTGRGITEIDEIHGWARRTGIPLFEVDVVKHMNADQAACGYGCSGNPYDAYWSFNPLGHGDLHELGHGLERSRMRFEGQSGHTITNPYSYYAKSRFQTETIGTTDCQNLPYETLFNQIQTAAASDDHVATMRANDRTGWSWGAGVNYQTMMGAQDQGILVRGEHYLGRMHVLERAFNAAVRSDTLWAEQASALGFAGFTRADAGALSANDWNLIATSHVLGRNMTTWHELWGHVFSDTAKAHVSAMPVFPPRFYIASPKAACEGFPTQWLPIDGVSKWPADLAAEGSATGMSQDAMLSQPASDSCALH